MKAIRGHLSYANVLSTLAVFLVLGGGAAFAATQLPKNSVGTKQLRKNAVTAAKIKKRAVTGPKLKPGVVTTGKIAAGAVTGEKVDESSLGQVPDAKTLDGISASAFPLQAHSAIADNALVGKSGTAREVDITAPQDGFLLAIASADVFGSAANLYECELVLDGEKQVQTRRESALGTGNLEENCDTNAILPVTAGKHNVKFDFTNIAATTTVDETELDVVFVALSG